MNFIGVSPFLVSENASILRSYRVLRRCRDDLHRVHLEIPYIKSVDVALPD